MLFLNRIYVLNCCSIGPAPTSTLTSVTHCIRQYRYERISHYSTLQQQQLHAYGVYNGIAKSLTTHMQGFTQQHMVCHPIYVYLTLSACAKRGGYNTHPPVQLTSGN